MSRKIFLAVALLLTTFTPVAAMTPPESQAILERALTLLEHRRWNDARHEFMRLQEITSPEQVSLKQQIDFGLTVCAVELGVGDSEQRMLDYLLAYPESVHCNDIRFLLGLHYCKNEEFAKAREEFLKVSYKALTLENRERYNVRMGYAEFVGGDYGKALEYFDRVSPTGEYADHATYYKSYIAYSQGNYDEAYKGFQSLKKSDAYSAVIPYYLLQIEFARGNYEYVVHNGEQLLAKSVESERLELMRVLAESWYRLQEYDKSLLYITMYEKSGGAMNREENYILGYSAYRTADYVTAIDAFRKVCTGEDSLAQNASYHLADCYIKRGDKRMAIYAFAMAASDKFDNEIAEDALFNYGKLLFETGGGTFNESINVLTRYVNRYPDSPRINQARELLIAAYYNSHDYEMAYKAIKSVERPDADLRTALQKMTYFRGLDSFRNGDYDKAKSSLEESMSVGVSPKYNALCSFWLGEIDYQRGEYASAVDRYNFYIKRAPKSADEYKMALYNLGYSQFALGDMPKAQRAFEGFLWLYKQPDSYRADAYNRLGDARYAQRNFDGAVESYEKSVAIDSTNGMACLMLGQALAAAGNLPGAENAYKMAMRNGQQQNAVKQLSNTYIKLSAASLKAKDYQGAIDYALKSNEYLENATAMQVAGQASLQLQKNDDAISYFEKYVALAPTARNVNDIFYSIAVLAQQGGDNAKACGYYQKITSDPKYGETAKQQIAALKCN